MRNQTNRLKRRGALRLPAASPRSTPVGSSLYPGPKPDDSSRGSDSLLGSDSTAEALLDWVKVGLPREKSRVIVCHGGPQIQYKDLQTVLNIKMNYDLLPFKCQTTFEKVSDATVLTTIGIQVQNKDLTY